MRKQFILENGWGSPFLPGVRSSWLCGWLYPWRCAALLLLSVTRHVAVWTPPAYSHLGTHGMSSSPVNQKKIFNKLNFTLVNLVHRYCNPSTKQPRQGSKNYLWAPAFEKTDEINGTSIRGGISGLPGYKKLSFSPEPWLGNDKFFYPILTFVLEVGVNLHHLSFKVSDRRGDGNYRSQVMCRRAHKRNPNQCFLSSCCLDTSLYQWQEWFPSTT